MLMAPMYTPYAHALQLSTCHAPVYMWRVMFVTL